MNFLRKTAIIAAAALSISAVALEPGLPVKVINGVSYYVYQVAPKETVYSITRRLGITRQQLIESNPQVADGLRAGDSLLFPVNTPLNPAAETVAEPEETPENKTEETAAEAFEAAEEIVKPAEPQTPTEPQTPAEPAPQQPVAAVVTETAVEADIDSASAEAVNIAVVLPFMLENESLTKSTENFTDFYKGLILGLDSLTAPAESMKFNVTAFDSESSPAKVAELAGRPEIIGADFIIAPEDSLSIAAIAASADTTDAVVLNLFAVKSTAHNSHESVLQGNISHSRMYETAIKAFCEANAGKKAIILNATDIPADKSSFTDALAEAMVRAGIPYERIDYSGKLTAESLLPLSEGKDYVFIPTSHSREALMRIIPAVEEFKTARIADSVSMFGYPEWIILRGDIKDHLHSIDTTIYSRFSNDRTSPQAVAIADAYERTYGEPLEKSAPVSALMGFDTAAWIVAASESGIDAPFQGVQNSFKFVEIPGAGNENSALYLINFKPGGQTAATLL